MMRLHIDRAALAAGSPEPIVVRAFEGGKAGAVVHAAEVEILGPSKFVFDPAHPLESGAYAWIETSARVKCLKRPEPDKPHTHRCTACGTSWTHHPAVVTDQDKAHQCPTCGKSQYQVSNFPRLPRSTFDEILNGFLLGATVALAGYVAYRLWILKSSPIQGIQ